MSGQIKILQQQLLTVKLSKEVVALHIELAKEFAQNNLPKDSHIHAKEALKISEKENYIKETITALFLIANSLYLKSDYREAIRLSKEALLLVETNSETSNTGILLNLLGISCCRIGDLDMSLEYHLKCLDHRKQYEEDLEIPKTLINIGNVYNDMGEYDNALSNYAEALKVYQKFDHKKGEGVVLGNQGMVYSNLKKYDDAIKCLTTSIAIATEVDDEIGMMFRLNILGEVYNCTGIFLEAEKCFFEAKQLSVRLQNRHVELASLVGLAMSSKGLNKEKEAFVYLDIALNIAKELDAKLILFSILERYADFYESMGNYQKAYEHLKNSFEIKEQVFSQEKNRHIMNLRTESIEKEKEIEKLKNIELKKANELIEEKQSEILSSIRYAKRIQENFLADKNDVKTIFPESFILFKPKDIVSGDFYLVEKLGDKIYFAVADCTGHGVPGGMLTMLGQNILKQSLDKKIIKPSLILDFLNEEIKRVFKKMKNDVQINDGMDITFCSLDISSNSMEVAAAYNNLWIIRGKTDLIEIKADKIMIGNMSAGSLTKYNNNEIPLQKGDTIYLFSDGYCDQMGGIDNKKFMKKRLKEKLLSIQHNDMETQEKILDETIECWKGERDQIDDITIMGIRI